ncbi:MAG: metallophosphoesterase [Chloroflexota bacterium]
MRIAIFSDIHGNSVGLDAVLADIESKGGVDHYWVLGDHTANGPDPAGVMRKLLALPNAEFIHGNGDRYIYTGNRPPPTPEDIIADPSLLPILAEIEGNFSWVTGIMAEFGWINWLESLPFEIHKQLPDGTTMQGIHSSPWRDDDEVGFCPLYSDTQIEEFANACTGDLVFCGHTHWPWDVRHGQKRIVNVGSIGNPNVASLNACWTLITADENGYQLDQFEIPYDRQAIINMTLAKRQPGSEFINSHYRGDRIRPWERVDRL